MELNSKINLETYIYIEFNLSNNKLNFELINKYDNNDSDNDDLDIYQLKLYKQNINGIINYNNINYTEINLNPLLKNKKLDEGYYLFIYNKTKLFIEFNDNKILFEIENIGVNREIDIS
jgi:hypothetical protein